MQCRQQQQRTADYGSTGHRHPALQWLAIRCFPCSTMDPSGQVGVGIVLQVFIVKRRRCSVT